MEDKELRIERMSELLTNDSIRYLYLVSLISSDNIVDVESAEKALENINFLLDNIDDFKVSDEIRAEIREYAVKGLDIVTSDIEEFKKQ